MESRDYSSHPPNLAEKIGPYHTGWKEYEEAIRWYKRALKANEHESTYWGIMYCYFELGRRPEAVMQYRRCEEILKRELDLGLSPETGDCMNRSLEKELICNHPV